MQIGTPGNAYGPGGVMSRPTLGRAVTPLPGTQDGGAVQAALAQARRMPTRFDGSFRKASSSAALTTLLKGMGSHVNVRHGVLQNELARRLAAGAHQSFQEPVVGAGGTGGPPALSGLAEGISAPQDFLPQTPIATVDPSVLLARARLAQMMGTGS